MEVQSPSLPVATDEGLAKLLDLSETQPILLYFTVVWCGPCAVFGPLMNEYAAERPALSAYRVDCEESPAFADHFGVSVFPTLMVIRGGAIHWSHAGAMDKSELAETVDPVVAAVQAITGSLPVVEDTPQPASLELDFTALSADRRIRVEVVRRDAGGVTADEVETIDTSACVVLGEADVVRLFIEADERMPHPLDLSPLADLPNAPYEHVIIHARSIDAAQIEWLSRIHTVRNLFVSASEPLQPDALDALAKVQARAVNAHIPGIDAAALRRRMPGVTVNYSSISAELAARLAPNADEIAQIEWSAVDVLRAAVATGRRIVAMVQLEHPADLTTAAVWHEAHQRGILKDALTVSAHGSDLADILALEQGRPALVVWESGVLMRRADLPEASAEMLEAVGGSDEARSSAYPIPLPDRPARIIELEPADRGFRVELVAPGTASAGAVVDLEPGVPEAVPAGWIVRIREYVSADKVLPWQTWARLGVQALHLAGAVGADALTRAAELDRLEHLEVMSADPPAASQLALLASRLPSLRSVRMYGFTDAAGIGSTGSTIIINGSWPLPAHEDGNTDV